MSIENEICLWCQDSLKGWGPVMELTTEDFKLMFKHDATCKIIHCACFHDYQEKRDKEAADEEQKRSQGQSEPDLDQRPGQHTGNHERPHWWRILIAALSNQHSSDRGMRGIPRINSNWLDTPDISDLDWGQAMAMARLVGMEHYYQRMAPSLHTGPPIPFQTLPVPIQYSQRSLPPQPTQHLPAPVQYVRRYEDWSFPPRRTTLQSAPTFHNRFTPHTHPERCINGPFNSRQMTQTRNHFQPNLTPMAYALPQHPTGTYWSNLNGLLHSFDIECELRHARVRLKHRGYWKYYSWTELVIDGWL